ncbi:hypothetical protein [uncultured Roseibium sp.]|uniref:hypothetical protein n=1 Tax=uncultured Roseibium sp. TaxID=1936171 RepID=UPI0026185022|nr:hypothetical protein [uncultured Roseibium sp.]
MNDHAFAHFVSGQVLGARALNDLVSYLEGQDRLSRRTLSGIGVVCGFEVDAEGPLVHLSKGVAVTSEGYLIADDAESYDRVRPYELPVSDAEDVPQEQIDEERYPFFFDENDEQIPLFELVDTDFEPAPGEDDPVPLTAAFLEDKTVMLFLETRLESLKSCDVNDCSDKGAEWRFTVRRLLLTRDQADAILMQEEEIAGRPVDRATHPMNELVHLRLEKLKIAATGTDNFAALILRIVGIALKLSQHLPDALRNAYAAYGYLVADLYEENADVFPNTYFANVWGQLAQNIFMAQYMYDYMRDVVMAYNEFVEAAARFEQECLPNPDRFPRHVFLGDATDKPDAFATDFPTPQDVLAWNPFNASTGAGLRPRVAARRTHFVASPAHANGPRLEEVRSLFQRMHLLALTYRTTSRVQAPIRLTPSKTWDAPLSDRAIPFYYAFQPGSDLHTNWSYAKTRTRLLNTVYSYQFSAPTDEHPLHFRLDGQDFIRIEGIVGKPLGSAMAQLAGWKQQLGLSFSIEPVFMPLTLGADDLAGNQLDEVARAQMLQAARQLFLCRLSDIDLIFLVVIRAIFAFIVLLLQRLSRQPTTPGSVMRRGDDFSGPDLADGIVAGGLFEVATASRFAIDLDPRETEILRVRSDSLRSDIISRPFGVDEVLGRVTGKEIRGTAGSLFRQVGNPSGGANLFERTRRAIVADGGDEVDVRAAYAPVSLMSQGVGLMNMLSVDSLAEFQVEEFGRLYRGFSQAYLNYAQTFRSAPLEDPEARQNQASVVASAELVAAQSSAFAAVNINSEITATLQRTLSELTLGGYARRHPGLEHHAGVNVGGTYVLAYCSIDALRQQARPIDGVTTGPIRRLDEDRDNRSDGTIDGALSAVSSAHAFATKDPLDRFVVLADFCLPYQCCDTDCSDLYLRRRFSANPFDPEGNPGPMGVPPFDDDEPVRGGPDDIVSLIDQPIVNDLRQAGGILWNPGDFVVPDSDRDEDVVIRDEPPPDRARAILRGAVFLEGDRNREPVPETEVILSETGAPTRRVPTKGGKFEIPVRAGMIAVGAASPDLQGTMTTLHLDPGEEHELTLLVSKRRE